MSGVAKQLFQLQEVDLEIDAGQQSMKRMTAQLGESQTLIEARSGLAAQRETLETLAREQRSVETEAEDLTVKINAAEKDLYSGRIRIPKELSALQQDVALLRARRTQLEDRALVIMEQSESARHEVSRLTSELQTVEAGWRSDQERLNRELAETKAHLTNLQKKQQELAGGIEPQSLALYQLLRKQKGAAVARVEQGVCRGCRISLPVNELQVVRSGHLVQCSSCGRILYLP